MKKRCVAVLAEAGALMVLAFSLGACGAAGNANQAAAPVAVEEELVYAVTTYRTEEGNLDDYLEFGGDVASVSAVDVLPDQSGKLTRVLVSVGDKVAKDQVIAYVDASRPGMNYRESPVKAPISGRITAFTPAAGSTVSEAMSIAKISRTDELEIKMSVAERFISRIKNGQIANVSFDAYPAVAFTAKVTELSPVLDTNTRTMAVKLRLTKADDRVKVGMYARIRLVTDSRQNAIVVPSSCVITRDGKHYVFVVNGNSAALRAVTPGITVDNKTEIAEGLSAGEEIVSKGQSLLNDGARVNVISSTGAGQ